MPSATDSTESMASKVGALVDAVAGGQAIFFIGAGFSLDSEENSASRLLARLVARFDAMTVTLFRGSSTEEARQEAVNSRTSLVNTFSLAKLGSLTQSGPSSGWLLNLARDDVVWTLAQRYYDTNDWMCGAYARLLAVLAELDQINKVDWLSNYCNDLWDVEKAKLKAMGVPAHKLGTRLWAPRLRDLFELGDSFNVVAGKALFVETMGFADTSVMSGEPFEDQIPEMCESYATNLRERHHVLARFAREGLCPIIITTNYDLLLEGGLRLAGFVPDQREGMGQPEGSEATLSYLPPCDYGRFVSISEAQSFFAHGMQTRSAQLVKIHGCIHSYREASILEPGRDDREASTFETDRALREASTLKTGLAQRKAKLAAWASCLETIVFTYREIQNWRDDSWSRDLLRTLLRTRTIVFCGYSGADPVIHDTFRSVYEEMALKSAAARSAVAKPEEAIDLSNIAPAFFLSVGGDSGTREFHGMEILKAASMAAGHRPSEPWDHDQYLPFHLPGKGVPDLDELFDWIRHGVVRRLVPGTRIVAVEGVPALSGAPR